MGRKEPTAKRLLLLLLLLVVVYFAVQVKSGHKTNNKQAYKCARARSRLFSGTTPISGEPRATNAIIVLDSLKEVFSLASLFSWPAKTTINTQKKCTQTHTNKASYLLGHVLHVDHRLWRWPQRYFLDPPVPVGILHARQQRQQQQQTKKISYSMRFFK